MTSLPSGVEDDPTTDSSMTGLPSGVDNDPTRAFGAALPDTIRRRVLPTQKLVADIAAAVRKGWTVEQLAAEASRDIRAGDPNPGALVTFRVQRAAEIGPPQPAGPVRFVQPLVWCGDCDSAETRWIETVDGKLMRCPTCWVKPGVA